MIFISFSYNININMTQYNALNIKLSNLQLKKLKPAIKNGPEVTLKFSSNIIGDSNDENNFFNKILLINSQVSKLRKSSANNYSGKSGENLGIILGPLQKAGLEMYSNH